MAAQSPHHSGLCSPGTNSDPMSKGWTNTGKPGQETTPPTFSRLGNEEQTRDYNTEQWNNPFRYLTTCSTRPDPSPSPSRLSQPFHLPSINPLPRAWSITGFPIPFPSHSFDGSSSPNPSRTVNGPQRADSDNQPNNQPVNYDPPEVMPRVAATKRTHTQMRRASRDGATPYLPPQELRSNGPSQSTPSAEPRSGSRLFKRPKITGGNSMSIPNLVSRPTASQPRPPISASVINGTPGDGETADIERVNLAQALEDSTQDDQLKTLLATQSSSTTAPPAGPKQSRIQDFECCICMSPPTDLTMTPCGHLFCWECIHRAANAGHAAHPYARASSKMSKCPNCRKPFSTNTYGEKGLIPLRFKVRRAEVLPKHKARVVDDGDGRLFVPEDGNRDRGPRRGMPQLGARNSKLVATPVIELD